MKEIGGYFGFENLIENEYYSDVVAVNSARNALIYILKAKKASKIYIPKFLCDSVFKVCEKEGYQYAYYDINENFEPIFNGLIGDDEYLYVVNYYGQLSNERIAELKNQYGNIIVDNVQAFFQRPVKGIDTVYSCRKFFGVPDGGYASVEQCLDEQIDVDTSFDRMTHILGRYDKDSASLFYDDYRKNEDKFENMNLKYMSKITRNILGAIDYQSVKDKREQNYRILEKGLSDINKLKLSVPQGPFAYPFYCKNGMEVKRTLAKKGIYIATLWPEAADFGGICKDYSENILPIPCDQRYNENNMKYLVEEIRKCLKS